MAARQIAEVQPANANANEPFNIVADFIKHPPNLAIDSLTQDHAQSRRLDGMNFLEPGALTIERDAAQ
jgi:hypothetical protein